jgi:hypothetical protein
MSGALDTGQCPAGADARAVWWVVLIGMDGAASGGTLRASSAQEELTVTGKTTPGMAKLEARYEGSDEVLKALEVDVKKRKEIKIVIHAITEENDDTQELPPGFGPVDPQALCVHKGRNEFLDTEKDQRDAIGILGDIVAGADQRCHTVANGVNLPARNVPDPESLRVYLNDVIWGKQANVYIPVGSIILNEQVILNYDLNQNELLDTFTTREIAFILSKVVPDPAAINIYYVFDLGPGLFGDPVGVTDESNRIFIQDRHRSSTNHITAHELGHALGQGEESSNKKDVMYDTDLSDSCNVRKVDWDAVNGN